MRIVIALGGNALLQRGQPMTAENQRANIHVAAERIAAVAPATDRHRPRQRSAGRVAGPKVPPTKRWRPPLDVLGAETEAMIGYVIEQELGNLLPFEQSFATLLTMIEVDPKDPAFAAPPSRSARSTPRVRRSGWPPKGWAIAPDGDHYRRVVPSPKPKRIFEIGRFAPSSSRAAS